MILKGDQDSEVQDGQIYMKRICQLYLQLENAGVQLVINLKADKELREEALRLSTEVYRSENSENIHMAQSFDALNLQLGFQLEKCKGVAPQEMMEELSTCFMKFQVEKEKSKKKKKEEKDPPIVVLTDLLVALVSSPSQILPVLVKRGQYFQLENST